MTDTTTMPALPILAGRGHRFLHGPDSAEQWQATLRAGRAVPRDAAALRQLARRIYRAPAQPGMLPVQHPDIALAGSRVLPSNSGSEAMLDFAAGLRNPALTADDLAELDRHCAAAVPDLEFRLRTAHFEIAWTTASSNPRDNLADTALPAQIGNTLEAAWQLFDRSLARQPWLGAAAVEGRIAVQLFDLGGFAPGWTAPDGPICLDIGAMSANAQLSRATPVFELFQRILFACGWQTEWTDTHADSRWCSQGMGRWAQWWASGLIGEPLDLRAIADAPQHDPLADFGYAAMPFWVYLAGQQPAKATSGFFLPKLFLDNLAECRGFQAALNSTLAQNVTYRLPADWFMFLFYINLVGYAWLAPGLYNRQPPEELPSFTDSSGHKVAPASMPRLCGDMNLALGQSCAEPRVEVDARASRYWRFSFDGAPAKSVFSAEALGFGNDAFWLGFVYLKQGRPVNAFFPVEAGTNKASLSDSIDPDKFDAIVVVVTFDSQTAATGRFQFQARLTAEAG